MNTRIFISIFFVTALVGGFFAGPHTASAAYLYVTSSVATGTIGNTIILDIKLNTEGTQLNAVEGLLHLSGAEGVLIKEINTGGSAFTLWPTKPFYSSSDQSISFSGGVPHGVTGDALEIFRLILQPTAIGDLSIQSSTGSDVTGYVNNGRGTSIAMIAKPFTLANVVSSSTSGRGSQDAWQQIVMNDRTPPEPFTIEIAKDPSLFDDNYFISFNTTDGQSGIDHYEVREGSKSPVRSESPYNLQNQDPHELITVSAYDKAGNVRTISINESNLFSLRNVLIAIILLIIVIVGGVMRKEISKEIKRPKNGY